MDQGMEVGMWLGIGGLALIWGNVQLWHTRRALKRLRQEAVAPVNRAVPSPVGEAIVGEAIGSGIAS